MGQIALFLLNMGLSESVRNRLTFVLPWARTSTRIENLTNQEQFVWLILFPLAPENCHLSRDVVPIFSPFLSFFSFSMLAQIYSFIELFVLEANRCLHIPHHIFSFLYSSNVLNSWFCRPLYYELGVLWWTGWSCSRAWAWTKVSSIYCLHFEEHIVRSQGKAAFLFL